MSYRRSYSHTVSETISVRYPASQNGGTTSATVNIPIYVDIDVDTVPFDNSVERCENNINLLTGAVVATEAAEIKSINDNAKKVSKTLIGGFFSYIRSEISQQVAELSQNVEAQLLHLKELAQTTLSKKKQMEGDYNRITSRYMKIFEDLNHELSNRINELDKTTFSFRKITDQQRIRTTDNLLVNTVTVFGPESNGFNTKICASYTKKHALDSINKARLFLIQQKSLNAVIKNNTINEDAANTIYVPVCFIETRDITNRINKNISATDFYPALNSKRSKDELISKLSSDKVKWNEIAKDDMKNLNIFFNLELNKRVPGGDLHSERIKETIQKMAKISAIKVINV